MQRNREQQGFVRQTSAASSFDQRTRDAAAKETPANRQLVSTISSAGRERNWDQALVMFESMQDPQTMSFNAVMNVGFKLGRYEEVLDLFGRMCNAGIENTAVTYNIVIKALGRLRRYDQARTLWSDFKTYGIARDSKSITLAYTSILDAAAQCGLIGDVKRLYIELMDEGGNPDLVVFGVLLNACKGAVAPFEARYFLDQMDVFGICANNIHYNSAMLAHLGQSVEQLKSLESEMLSKCILPNKEFVEAYICSLLGTFIKTDQQQEVSGALRNLPAERIQAIAKTIARAKHEGCILKHIVQRAEHQLRKDHVQFECVAGPEITDLGVTVSAFPPKPVYVKSVIHGGWARKHGLTDGNLILALNGRAIEKLDKSDFKALMRARPLCMTVTWQ